MPFFKPVIRVNEKRSDDTINIKIRVTHAHKVRYVATSYYVYEENFDQGTGRVVTSKLRKLSRDEADRINNRLTVMVSGLIRRCENIPGIRTMDIRRLMDILREDENKKAKDFFSVVNERIEQLGQSGNMNYQDSYVRTRNILESFSGNYLPFSAIDLQYLRNLEHHLRTIRTRRGKLDKIGQSINSIGIHMRNIRTIYNLAIGMGVADLSAYPFRQYKIKKETTRHRTLAGEEIAKLYRVSIDDSLLAWSRDMAMLSFFLIGINTKDMLYLTDIVDGRIEYIRSKGKRSYSVKVYPEAMEIIKRYRGEKYLLNTLENYTYYRNATKRINKKLKDLAVMCGIDKPITTYYMRHSWATIARHLGVSIDDISMALGHQRSSLEITEIYIDEDSALVDIANRTVIDYIVGLDIPADNSLDQE